MKMGIQQKRGSLNASQKRFLWFWVVPVFLLYLYICILPVAESVINSFTQWDGYSEKQWIGLGNYVRILKDSVFHQSVINDILIVFFKELIIVVLAVTFAIALTRIRLKKPEKLALRFLYYLPNILSVIVISMVWKFFFNLELFDGIQQYPQQQPTDHRPGGLPLQEPSLTRHITVPPFGRSSHSRPWRGSR